MVQVANLPDLSLTTTVGSRVLTNILQSLGWPTLETRRKGARLILLFKILHGEAAVNIPEYVRRTEIQRRQHHKDRDRFAPLGTLTDAYKYSFIPRTITDQLPETVIQAPSNEAFQARVHGSSCHVWGEGDVFILFLICFNLCVLVGMQVYLHNGSRLQIIHIEVEMFHNNITQKNAKWLIISQLSRLRYLRKFELRQIDMQIFTSVQLKWDFIRIIYDQL